MSTNMTGVRRLRAFRHASVNNIRQRERKRAREKRCQNKNMTGGVLRVFLSTGTALDFEFIQQSIHSFVLYCWCVCGDYPLLCPFPPSSLSEIVTVIYYVVYPLRKTKKSETMQKSNIIWCLSLIFPPILR